MAPAFGLSRRIQHIFNSFPTRMTLIQLDEFASANKLNQSDNKKM